MIWLLLLLFQIKHFLCDYPLQTPQMLAKGAVAPQVWIPALIAHSAVHAAGTLLIALSVAPQLAFALAVADFALHFVVDRIKASPALGGRWAPNVPQFWWALGFDQLAHHAINIGFVYVLVNS